VRASPVVCFVLVGDGSLPIRFGRPAEGPAAMSDQRDDANAKKRPNRPNDPVYSDDLDSILARNKTRKPPLRTDEIVRIITRGENYSAVRELAKKWAQRLGISPAEFIRLAGPRS
jgi:hypothetical protein